jgi:uncharacterized iron-regulated membrane protein
MVSPRAASSAVAAARDRVSDHAPPPARSALRGALIVAHRVVGLFIASFLIIAGLTGAIICWHDELDTLLNPELHHARGGGPALAPLELALRIEAWDMRAQVSYLPLSTRPGETLSAFVAPRIDPASGAPFDLDYDQLFVDPASGAVLGARKWGRPGLDRAHLVPFLYALHYGLCVPSFLGVDRWGMWLMGGVALLWIVDCCVGLALTLPPAPRPADRRRRSWFGDWRIAWRIKWPAAPYRLAVDAHRAFGLWLWSLLLILAISGACLNLDREVARPLIGLFMQVTPDPATDAPRVAGEATGASVSRRADIIAAAARKARELGWAAPPGAIAYSAETDAFRVDFFVRDTADDGPMGAEPNALYFDAGTARFLGVRDPWNGGAGDLFLALQLPLHSGKIVGLPGRIAVSVMGLVVAVLSATGVVIWYRKHRAKAVSAARRNTQTTIHAY